MLNDGRVGGYFQPRANTGASLTATWSNITFQVLPATERRSRMARSSRSVPSTTARSRRCRPSDNYPASVSITDAMFPGCVGFANLHSWSFLG